MNRMLKARFISLLRTLVDPGANQTDLFCRERLGWRTESAGPTWTSRRTPAGTAAWPAGGLLTIGALCVRGTGRRPSRSTWSSGPTGTAALHFGWHGIFRI